MIFKVCRRIPQGARPHLGALHGYPEDPEGDASGRVGTKSGPSRDQVRILEHLAQDRRIAELMVLLQRSNRTKFRDETLNPLLEERLVEMTVSDKPRSSKQRYRLTDKGRQALAASLGPPKGSPWARI